MGKIPGILERIIARLLWPLMPSWPDEARRIVQGPVLRRLIKKAARQQSNFRRVLNAAAARAGSPSFSPRCLVSNNFARSRPRQHVMAARQHSRVHACISECTHARGHCTQTLQSARMHTGMHACTRALHANIPERTHAHRNARMHAGIARKHSRPHACIPEWTHARGRCMQTFQTVRMHTGMHAYRRALRANIPECTHADPRCMHAR
jgi:hypothetical protein